MATLTVNARSHGFSLVELMIALTLSLFLLGGVIVLATAGSSAARDAERMARAQESLRFISNFMVQELRMTGSFPLVQNPPPTFFSQNSASSITVRYEAAADCLGQSTAPTNGIATNTYSLSGNRLLCNGGQNQVGTMLEGLADLAFTSIFATDGVTPLGLIIAVSLEDDPFPDVTYSFVVAFRNPVIRQAF